MALTETEGMSLKSYDLADADKIIVFFTKDNGLIRGVAKGAKRLKSKFGSSLEPFSIVQLTYLEKDGRELVSIQQNELIKSYFNDASKPKLLQTFGYLFDLLCSFAPPNEPNKHLYRMTKACLELGVGSLKDIDSIALYFEFWILRLSGYLPNWEVCGGCKRRLNNKEFVTFQTDFRVFCAGCTSDGRGQKIASVERFVFLAAQSLSPTKFIEAVRGKNRCLNQVSVILKQLISQMLDREVADVRSFRRLYD